MPIQDRKKLTKHIRLVIIAAIILLIIYKITYLSIQGLRLLDEDLPSQFSMSAEDSAIIKPEFLSRIKVNEVKRNRLRNDITFATLQDSFKLVIHKLDLYPDAFLSTAVHLEQRSVDKSSGVFYSEFSFANCKFYFRSTGIVPSSNLYLTLSADSVRMLHNNYNKVAYSLHGRNVSLRYAPDAPIDVYIESKGGFLLTKSIPISLMFLKKNGAVYFIILRSLKDEPLAKSDRIMDIIS